ncbi:PTH2-domain-containing protein [Schizophyllum commune]
MAISSTPSLTAIGTCVALAAASLSAGYWAGAESARRKFARATAEAPTSKPQKEPTSEDESEGESDEEFADGDLASVKVDPGDQCKMVLVVRQDLGMSSGKIAAQCSHATLACYKTLASANPLLLRQWERVGQTKIALRCSNEEELLTLQAQAQSLNLCARSIQDAGRTQIAAGSRTVLGIIGPARLVNQVTGKLRLL